MTFPASDPIAITASLTAALVEGAGASDAEHLA
jgi:hypothetical protein